MRSAADPSVDVKDFIKLGYNRLVRPHTPRKLAVFNGVAVRGVRLLDFHDEFPDYESPLIDTIRDNVVPGEHVAIIGGGRGVSSVVAAHRVGREGRVSAYEGSRRRTELARETADLNQVADIVSVEHAVVGDSLKLADDSETGQPTAPDELPNSDILVLDCEGSEIEILSKLEIRPRVLIVESHGFLDAPESRVRDLLEELHYQVVDRSVEDDENGVIVLTAVPNMES